MAKKKGITGFTLIELLVVIAIIALLLSILLPGLKKAKNYAKRVVCAGRLSQIGLGLKLYADANKEFLPTDMGNDNKTRETHSYVVYRRDDAVFRKADGTPLPLRFARLYETGYMDLPEVFYCPGNVVDSYKYESYTNPEPWGYLPQKYNQNTSNEWVRIGYTYYPNETRVNLLADGAPKELAMKYTTLNPNLPQTTDVIHNRNGISHQSSKIYGLNALFSDGHVAYCNDQDVFNVVNPYTNKNIWNTLDAGGFPLRFYDEAYYTVFRAIGP
jgi:prepilin-type N-terminal cleavage/methylation domain-containing protein/prepilin-type processing-associated H-X9-DG protein